MKSCFLFFIALCQGGWSLPGLAGTLHFVQRAPVLDFLRLGGGRESLESGYKKPKVLGGAGRRYRL